MKLQIEDLTFRYKTHTVFEHVHYSFDGARFCCLIGPNGAGKSTLLKCINGILTPAGGRILADGKEVLKMSLRERAAIFGYVPQFTIVNPCLNVLETVISGRMPQMNGRTSVKDVEEAEKILEEMDLTDFAMRPLHHLSGGERQRILIARALAQEPKIMLLDEPTSNLDLHYQLETMELMKKMTKEKQIGVIAVIHDLNSVLRYADEAVLLDRGGIICFGEPSRVIDQQHVADSFAVQSIFTKAADIPVMVPLRSHRNVP